MLINVCDDSEDFMLTILTKMNKLQYIKKL